MTFADLAVGDAVFIDANTFVYHCSLEPKYGPACTDLLDRVGLGEIIGQQFGLLSNDALVVAVMQAHG